MCKLSIDEEPEAKVNETGPTNDVDVRFFIKELLETIGWDLISNEVGVEEGVPLVKRNGKYGIFESLDNIINIRRAELICNWLESGSLNRIKGSEESHLS